MSDATREIYKIPGLLQCPARRFRQKVSIVAAATAARWLRLRQRAVVGWRLSRRWAIKQTDNRIGGSGRVEFKTRCSGWGLWELRRPFPYYLH